MKIGIYGGTFDPVHFGHLLPAQYVLEELHLDKIIFIPAAIPPHKKRKGITDAETRWQMLSLAIANNLSFEASRIEIDRPGISYTVQTLEQLHQILKITRNELYFLIGADSLVDLHKWFAPQRIFELSQVVVFPRANVRLEDVRTEFLEKIILVEAPLIDISSTAIRQNVLTGRSIKYWVPEPVRSFIEEKKLYR